MPCLLPMTRRRIEQAPASWTWCNLALALLLLLLHYKFHIQRTRQNIGITLAAICLLPVIIVLLYTANYSTSTLAQPLHAQRHTFQFHIGQTASDKSTQLSLSIDSTSKRRASDKTFVIVHVHLTNNSSTVQPPDDLDFTITEEVGMKRILDDFDPL